MKDKEKFSSALTRAGSQSLVGHLGKEVQRGDFQRDALIRKLKAEEIRSKLKPRISNID